MHTSSLLVFIFLNIFFGFARYDFLCLGLTLSIENLGLKKGRGVKQIKIKMRRCLKKKTRNESQAYRFPLAKKGHKQKTTHDP